MWGTDGPAFEQLLDLGVETGSMADLTGDDTVALSVDEAKAKKKPVGSEVELKFPNGQTQSLRVVATYSEDGLIGQGSPADYLLSLGAYEANMPAQLQTDQRVLVKGAEGVSLTQLRAAVDRVAEAYPTSKVQDVEQIEDTQTEQLTDPQLRPRAPGPVRAHRLPRASRSRSRCRSSSGPGSWACCARSA